MKEPLLYHIIQDNEKPMYENALPIHRKTYDIARMDIYELYLKVKALNPRCVLVGIKTDCIVFNKVKVDPELTKEWGGIKKCDVPVIKECTVDKCSRKRTDEFVNSTPPASSPWNRLKWTPSYKASGNKEIETDEK